MSEDIIEKIRGLCTDGRAQEPRLVIPAVQLWPDDFDALRGDPRIFLKGEHTYVLTCNGETRIEPL